MVSKLYLTCTLLAAAYNTLSYAEYTDFCLSESDVRIIDGYYDGWPQDQLKKCPGIYPVWYRNESYYAGDEGLLVTYIVWNSTLYLDDTNANGGVQSITGYAFYRCDQVASAFKQCALNDELCDDVPVILCTEAGNGSFSGCKKWNVFQENYIAAAEPTHFNLQNGSCPWNLTASLPLDDPSDTHTRSSGQDNSGSSSVAQMAWTIALVAISIIALVVIIWSTVRVCRKYNMMDQMRYSNRTVVADEGSDDDEDEIEPPKKKAPPVPIEMRTKNSDATKNGTEQLIPNKTTETTTLEKENKDFAIGHESDEGLSDESV